MQITRLRLLGFKSFVEPTELLIEPGLTGVVGPNGCGKSNLLEALRWVMGETSYKSMRASGMDDVIFSGTDARPARDTAEVTVFIDNSDRSAPAAFNDYDIIEISRRIQREAGSIYKVNGREARARDVQLLFADAATGARSQALVPQGRIGEIVNAKPEQRRRILEDAAGIAGLHGRRHEAELRLRAAENNLERLQDVMGQINSQLQNLKRQARQARRYKEISSELRKAEAVQQHLMWRAAGEQVAAEEAALQEAVRTVGQLTQAESAALRAEADGSEALQPLREEEATRAAVLHRLYIEQETLEKEEARAIARREELEARVRQITADMERERQMIEEARELLKHLDSEESALRARDNDDAGRAEAKARAEHAASELALVEEELAKLTGEAADLRARRRQLEAQIQAQEQRLADLGEQDARIVQQLRDVDARLGEQSEIQALNAEVLRLAREIEAIEADAARAEDELAEARACEKKAREDAGAAGLQARQLETEVATLVKLLRPSQSERWRPVVDEIRVTPGHEAALGAALGDDLDMPADCTAPAHWAGSPVREDDPNLPEGAQPFTKFVQAPDVLNRRLRQIGLVNREDGERLAPLLKPGQRLVTLAGDLWRWDGVFAAANAPTAAAKRLAERNRLDDLTAKVDEAKRAALQAETAQASAQERVRSAQCEEKRLRELWRSTHAELARVRELLGKTERGLQQFAERRAALIEAQTRIRQDLRYAQAQKQDAERALAGLSDAAALDAAVAEAQDAVAEKRNVYAEAKSILDGIERERVAHAERLDAIAAERVRTRKRKENAEAQIAALTRRLEEARDELQRLSVIPAQVAARREKLFGEIAQAEAARKQAADNLATAEATLRDNARALREAQARLTEARENRARIEARLDAARQRRAEQARQIRELLQCAPEDCLAVAGIAPGTALPGLDEIEQEIVKLRSDRERLGGVNLRAEEELEQLSEEFDELARERDDLEQAIAKLRYGIASLNREGRKRLLEAFDVVNAHFQRLFRILFGGGEAELQLIESDDPLESGLEIVARPPGKKPQVLTLLSGGEMALTALALIFAVFLTNPSPICVLDEVDAPLDDANVERFCAMMEEMGRSTKTRFLVITHNPITMARMDRLFGVTMAEKGISQLVSVDLQTAERFLEAG